MAGSVCPAHATDSHHRPMNRQSFLHSSYIWHRYERGREIHNPCLSSAPSSSGHDLYLCATLAPRAANLASLEKKFEIGGNDHGWPANSEGLSARDCRCGSRKRHRMVRLLYFRKFGRSLVGQVLRTEPPGCSSAEHDCVVHGRIPDPSIGGISVRMDG